MTPEQIEFHRKKFEEVCGWKSEYVFRKDTRGEYECYETGILFQGYLLAIESIEVELPDYEESDHFSPDYYAGYEESSGAISEYLKSLGLKVKER